MPLNLRGSGLPYLLPKVTVLYLRGHFSLNVYWNTNYNILYLVCLNSVVQEIICTCNWSLWPRPQINTGTSINHRCPDLTPLRLFKNRQFWPDVYTQDDKTRISKLKQTGNQACKQILIHGFLKHSQKSVLRLIVSLIVSGATFQARKVTLSKYFSFLSSLWVVALSFW